MNKNKPVERFRKTKLIILSALIGIILFKTYDYFYLQITRGIGLIEYKWQNLQQDFPLPGQVGNPKLHSQFLEDYILSIVFDDQKKGVYIDVGANNPNKDSVTKHFYDLGWRGVNIEPIPENYRNFTKYRPGDINLNTGISDKKGEMQFYHITSHSGLSTFDKQAFLNAKGYGCKYEISQIPVITLNNVLEQHLLQQIDFVNIDVEGMEKQVLQGLDLKKYRPAVFIIEATLPCTAIPSHSPWENILLDNHYKFMLFDGINRYYLADEHSERLLPNFKKAYQCALRANNLFHVINNDLIAGDM